MKAGRLHVRQEQGVLELDGALVHPGEKLALWVLGAWIAGRISHDPSGWYLLTPDGVSLRLQEGLFAHITDSLPDTPLILLVEDDAIHAQMMSQILEGEMAAQVVQTSDAHTAWCFLQDVTPHLLLLDYRLPGMTGLDLYDRLHADPRFHDLPVLLVSAAEPASEAQQRGVPYLAKPFELDDLLEQVETLITS